MFDVNEGDVRGRIAELVKNVGGASAAGRLLGMTREQISKWAAGDARPPLLAIARMCDAADTSLDWVVFGPPFQPSLSAKIGAPSRRAEQRPPPSAMRAMEDPDVVQIPLLDVVASAGSGISNPYPTMIDRLPFPRRWLDELGVPEAAVQFLPIHGDSMEPTVRDGAACLIDTRFQSPRIEAIYVVVDGDDVRLKRIGRGLAGSLTLISDNERYETEPLSAVEAAQLRIAGRAFWAGGKI